MFFSRYFSASLELQREQAAQAGAVLAPRRRRARRRPRSSTASPWSISAGKPTSVWPPLAHLHQLGQLAEGPGGVALAGARRPRLREAPVGSGAGCDALARRGRRPALAGAARPRRRRAAASAPPAPGTPPRAWAPSSAFSAARLRPMPSWRPCSSTTRKFMNRCGGSMSSLKSARLHVELGALAHAPRAARRSAPPSAERRASAHEARRRTRAAARSRERGLCGRLLSSACTLSFSMPGTSHSQRSSLDLVQHEERHRRRSRRRARRPARAGRSAAQSTPPSRTRLRKGLGRDAGRLVAHQLVARQQQQLRLVAATASRYQRSKVAPLCTSAGSCWS